MSYGRPTQSKAQTESNAKILRALVKQPDNKVCADCKRNDPRWASWNIGCFLCIRCSGIHRSMGTHISKVKSIDLDIWTPEQMAAIQKWGNRLSNLYWEAHLKAGHVPPEHKVESFVRSKYELRRWAKDGPIPDDPSVLDGGQSTAAAATAASPSATKSSTAASPSPAARAPAKPSALDLLGGDPTPSAATTGVSRGASNLLDDFSAPTNGAASRSSPAASSARQGSAISPRPSTTAAAAAAPAKSGGGGGLFDLDWHDGPAANQSSAPPSTLSAGAKGNKSDILSLYASAKPAMPTTSPNNVQQPTSPGQGGLAGLNASFGGLNMTGSGQSAGANPWSPATSTTTGGSNLFGSTSDPWGSSAATGSGNGSAFGATSGSDIWGSTASGGSNAVAGQSASAAKKNDAFDDIWSDFK